VVPKGLHVVNIDFDSLNIFDSLQDQVWVIEFSGIFSKEISFVFEYFKFCKDISKLGNSSFSSSLVLEEWSLSHLLSEMNNAFLKRFDVRFIDCILLLDNRGNRLLNSLGIILDFNPVSLYLSEFGRVDLNLWDNAGKHFD